MNKQMKIDETRTFEIDISRKVYCGEKPKELTGTTLESKVEELIFNTTTVEETSVSNIESIY